MYRSLYYVYTVAKNTTDQNKKVIIQMVNHVIFLIFNIVLYTHVYKLIPTLQEKLPFQNAIWSMSIYFIIFALGLRNLQRAFKEDIRSGNIEIYLLRPMNYIWQKVLVQVGQGIIAFLSALVLTIIVNVLLVGGPIITMPLWMWIILMTILFLLAQVLTCLLLILCGLSGFWIDDSEPVYFVVSKLIMIFGGAWVPVAFFPKTLQLIATFSPFGASVATSYMLYPSASWNGFVLILDVLFWIAICWLLTWFISKRAFKRLAVNG